MGSGLLDKWRAAWAALAAALAFSLSAAPFQLVTTGDPAQGAPAGGSGDSGAPLISADSHYVVFASTANNLMLTSSNSPIPAPFPAALNVYVRDRTKGTTRLVSVNTTGLAGGNSDSLPADISTNGQYVAFESSAFPITPPGPAPVPSTTPPLSRFQAASAGYMNVRPHR